MCKTWPIISSIFFASENGLICVAGNTGHSAEGAKDVVKPKWPKPSRGPQNFYSIVILPGDSIVILPFKSVFGPKLSEVAMNLKFQGQSLDLCGHK